MITLIVIIETFYHCMVHIQWWDQGPGQIHPPYAHVVEVSKSLEFNNALVYQNWSNGSEITGFLSLVLKKLQKYPLPQTGPLDPPLSQTTGFGLLGPPHWVSE